MVKNLLQCKRLSLIPGSGRSPGETHGHPVQYSCLKNSNSQRSLAGYSPWGHKELDTLGNYHFYFQSFKTVSNFLLDIPSGTPYQHFKLHLAKTKLNYSPCKPVPLPTSASLIIFQHFLNSGRQRNLENFYLPHLHL